MMAAAATMLAACTQTDLVQEVNTQQAISFESFAHKSTRQVSTTNLNDYHADFSVFGWDSEELLFDNAKVSFASSAWNYTGTPKYWDATEIYQFYAVAPYNANVTCTNAGEVTIPAAAAATAATQNLQTTFSVNQNEEKFTHNTDWLTASRTSYTMAMGTTVQFAFSHMMSKLIVAIQKEGNESITVESVSITDNHNALYSKAVYTAGEWTGNTPVSELEGVVGEMNTEGVDFYTMEYLIVPTADDANDLVFNIKYKITGETESRTKSAPVSNITTFKAGTSYTLTASIGKAPIKFSATVTPWATGTPGGAQVVQ